MTLRSLASSLALVIDVTALHRCCLLFELGKMDPVSAQRCLRSVHHGWNLQNELEQAFYF
jgi:hypothetical protein